MADTVEVAGHAIPRWAVIGLGVLVAAGVFVYVRAQMAASAATSTTPAAPAGALGGGTSDQQLANMQSSDTAMWTQLNQQIQGVTSASAGFQAGLNSLSDSTSQQLTAINAQQATLQTTLGSLQGQLNQVKASQAGGGSGGSSGPSNAQLQSEITSLATAAQEIAANEWSIRNSMYNAPPSTEVQVPGATPGTGGTAKGT